jgi:hypothetical protein
VLDPVELAEWRELGADDASLLNGCIRGKVDAGQHKLVATPCCTHHQHPAWLKMLGLAFVNSQLA